MQLAMDRIMLKFPIIGPILSKSAIARFARTLSTMFAAGVPLVEAMGSVAGATGNIVYEEAVLRMKDEVATGGRLQRAMENTGLFPNMVGADDRGRRGIGRRSTPCPARWPSSTRPKSTTRWTHVEPAWSRMIMAILGVLVGGMVIAMYLPIFKLGQVVG